MDGKLFLTLFVETGRVKDAGGRRLKTGLRQIAEKFPGLEFRLSANQNLILANIAETDKAGINALLAEHGVKTENQATALHAASMACPALPTCGLALAESERMLPGLIDRIEKLCGELGLGRRRNHHPLHRLPERLRAALHGGDRVCRQSAGTLSSLARR